MIITNTDTSNEHLYINGAEITERIVIWSQGTGRITYGVYKKGDIIRFITNNANEKTAAYLYE